jgi:hypothetical protein
MGAPSHKETDLIQRADSHQYGCILRVAEGASFLSLDDQTAVFSESAQRICGLNHMAANIWCRLEERPETGGLLLSAQDAMAVHRRAGDHTLGNP